MKLWSTGSYEYLHASKSCIDVYKRFVLDDAIGEVYVEDKAGESQGRAPGQASDYTLRAPTLLTVAPMTRRFTKISGPLTCPGPRYFAPPPCLLISRRPWLKTKAKILSHCCEKLKDINEKIAQAISNNRRNCKDPVNGGKTLRISNRDLVHQLELH